MKKKQCALKRITLFFCEKKKKGLKIENHTRIMYND